MTGKLFSEDPNAYQDAEGDYRYALGRRWSRGGRSRLYVMLNPSVASDTKRDNTLGRCVSFAQRDGFDALEIVNLYAYRTPHPSVLRRARRDGADIVGPRNDGAIAAAVARIDPGGSIVLAWGAQQLEGMEDRVSEVLRIVGARPVSCFGVNDDGSPRHPLMLPGDTPVVTFERLAGAHFTAKERSSHA